MTLTVDDRGSKTKLTITNGSKTLLRKSGTIKQLLKFVYSGTKNPIVKQSVLELQPIYKFMVGSKTEIEIKDNNDTRDS